MKKITRKFDFGAKSKKRPPNSALEDKPHESILTRIGNHFTWGKSKKLAESRIIWVAHRPPPHPSPGPEKVKEPKYPSNLIRTSKYTVWNFLPKNLFEQFRRLANFYFLIIAVIQMSLPNSPVSPMTSVLPLIFVVGVTAIKQGYEDYLRHKCDREVNNREVIVIRNGIETTVKSKNLRVGDIIKVKINREFPCDLVIVSSKESSGECYITTANLDGETNLKIHKCVPETKDYSTPRTLEHLYAVIECELPNTDLYRYRGRLMMFNEDGSEGPKCPLGHENIVLRGTSLKNTEYIYGCVVFTGQQTKMAMNSRMTSNKFSTIERSMNIYLILFLLLLVVEVCLCAALQYGYHSDSQVPVPWYIYIPSDDLKGVLNVLENVLSYIVLLNYTIPISMYVTIELQKFFGSMFFGWDEQIYDPTTDQCAKCNTSDLNEELGQVQYLFTDKTGTLTENDMQFRRCSINGVRYIEHLDHLAKIQNVNDEELGMASAEPEEQLQILTNYEEQEESFLLSLVLCHTAQVSPTVSRNGSVCVNQAFIEDDDDPTTNTHSSATPNGVASNELPDYQASSPDEKALLEACQRFGVVFFGLRGNFYHIRYKGRRLKYELLHVLEFDSDRKCMSVIVRSPQGQILLFAKGAETAILSRADSGTRTETLAHVNEYAMLGLRTLVVGQRELSLEEYERFSEAIREARAALQDREEKIGAVFETVERDLHILGATGVEDRLQDGVCETLEALREAGIKIWMLTGDKEETAINISYSCGHFNQNMIILYMVKIADIDSAIRVVKETKKKMDEYDPNSSPEFCLVVDGSSLAYIFQLENISQFREVCCMCKAVVCCRMSPIQKASIVRLIKNSPQKPTTAAIGDGANDVSMIQEAHVGLGVMGKEGRQAARCSDFAFARFRFLKRVLLVHGHYYYIRVAMLVQYSFYKNLAFITPQLYFVFYAWFSPQPLYDSMFLTYYNILFTSAPILIYGLMEQNISQTELMDHPEHYKKIANNALLTTMQFTKWTLIGFWHSLVFFYAAVLVFRCEVLSPYGYEFDINCLGTLVFHACVVIINLKLCLETRYFCLLFFASIAISILGFMGLTLMYCSSTFWKILSGGTTGMLWVYFQLLASGSFWCCTFLMLVSALLPDFCLETIYILYKGMKGDVASPQSIDKNHDSPPLGASNNNNNKSPQLISILYRSRCNSVTISQENILD